MDDVRLLDALRASATDVLEKMFFVRALAETGAKPGAPPVTAMVTFTGEASGWLRLEMSEAAARAIASDFLAEESAVLTRPQVGEVICELANMLCGSALSRREPGASFRLSAPQLVAKEDQYSDHASASSVTSAAIHTVEMGHGILTVAMNWGVPECRTSAELVS